MDNNRRIALNRAEAINHQNGTPYMKVPKIERLENCTMEIDSARGLIRDSHGGRINCKSHGFR